MYFIGTLNPISNRTGWLADFELDDADNGGPVDITGASIVIEVRDLDTGWIALSATTGNGKITILDTGVFRVNVAPGETQLLRAGTYEVGATITLNGESRQLIIGTLPVMDGVVSQL
jgi:hypothetical protein